MSLKLLVLSFTSTLDWGAYTVHFAETSSLKFGTLIRSVNFPSPEVRGYVYRAAILLSCLGSCF